MAQGIEEYMATITEKTKITIGFAVMLLGGLLWLTNIDKKADDGLKLAQANAVAYDKLSAEVKSYLVVQYQMATDIAVIKTILERGKGR
jgi:hypothetical protein